VHISWPNKRAEMSFLVNNSRAANNGEYGEDFYNFIELMKELCFTEMNLIAYSQKLMRFAHFIYQY